MSKRCAKDVIEPARRKENIFSGRLHCGSIGDTVESASGRLGFSSDSSGCNPRGLMVRSPMVAAGKLKWLRGA
jgi:hypothetical protein